MRMGTWEKIASRAATGAKPSRASVGRLSLYLRRLETLLRDGVNKVSSGQLGEALGVSDAQVRKDLAYRRQPRPSRHWLRRPGVDRGHSSCARHRPRLADRAGRCRQSARALFAIKDLSNAAFVLLLCLTPTPPRSVRRIDGLPVHALDTMPEILAATKAELGVLTVPSDAAQSVAEALAAAGMRGVLNFTPVVLRLPPTVNVRVRGSHGATGTAGVSRSDERRRCVMRFFEASELLVVRKVSQN